MAFRVLQFSRRDAAWILALLIAIHRNLTRYRIRFVTLHFESVIEERRGGEKSHFISPNSFNVT